MEQMLEKILNDRLDELKPYQQHILAVLILIPIAPFMVAPLMFFATMFAVNGVNELLDIDTDYVSSGCYVEPTRPWPRF